MKVTLLKEDKKYITLEQAPIVRQIISDMKEDENTPAEYADIAIRAAYDGNAYDIEVLKASAKISTNCRAMNCFTVNSSNLDVWIEATACVNDNEFIVVGAYLSDIWQITHNNRKEMASHMYIRKFKEVK